MKQTKKSKGLVWALSFVLGVSMLGQSSFAAIPEDRGIVSDAVAGTFQGQVQGDTIRNNLNFADVPANHWSKEAVSRLGALGIVQGYRENGKFSYRPNQSVSKEEAIALLLRAIGREAEAKKIAEGIPAGEAGQSNLNFWSKGYLTLAQQLGAISREQLNDALSAEQSALNPKENFRKGDAATREEVASWMVKLLSAAGSTELTAVYENKEIFRYEDWKQIGAEHLPYVEAVTAAGIMQGANHRFAPKKAISRAEMAQTLANLGDRLYRVRNISRKNGYIGHINDETEWNNQNSAKERFFLVRNQDGKVDKWIYKQEKDANGTRVLHSAPVYKYGSLTTLLSVKEGDKVEYLTDDNGNLLYVKVAEPEASYQFTGSLQPFDNLDKGQITLKDGENIYRFTMTGSLYRRNPDRIAMKVQYNNRFVPIADMPYSHRITVTVKDKLVTEIFFEGDIIRNNEVSGIIKDIQPNFNYLVIETWDGKVLNKKFRRSSVVVEKKPHYDNSVESGYFDEIFQHFKWDPTDSTIEGLEIGDMVHAVLSEEDSEYVSHISAVTNYIADFGQITNLYELGNQGLELTVRHPNGSTAVYTADLSVPVFIGEKRSALPQLKVGQRVKLLLNQTVLRPGTLKETVKEIAVDPLGNQVAGIYKGNIGLLNHAQKQLTLNQSYQLMHSRWDNYQESRLLRQNEQTKYFYNGKRVTADYVRKYLYTPEIVGYAVTTKFYSEEIVDTLSFRDSRETLLERDHVKAVKDNHQFTLSDHRDTIRTDEGTIILKDNHIVSFASILPPDYARVVLNGRQNAALVEVTEQPANDSLQIFRGRIAKINETKDFTLQSNAALNGMVWIYSPIQRQFEMDYRTKIFSGDKWISQAEFLSYSEISHTNKVYNIIADGTKAEYVIEQPYLREGLKGTIYAIDKETVKLKDIFVYQGATKKWVPLSLSNNYGEVTLNKTALLFRQSKVSETDSLKVGETIRVMGTEDMVKSLKNNSDRSMEAYLLFVEE